MYYNLLIIFITLLSNFSCIGQVDPSNGPVNQDINAQERSDVLVIPGAYQINLYLPSLRGKRVSMVVNHTSTIGSVHLVDSLLKLGIEINRIFAPEHGFRGKADAGEHVSDQKDPGTGLPITSLYGSKRAPSASDLANTDLVIFDIQDVGARFYTYISTMHYVMESCARQATPVMVLDRPNPNGHYVDGPVREDSFQSFVGMHPVPVVYGMTIGEYAQMINGEGWLGQGLICDLTVIPIANYNHQTMYELPIPPSPNLPNLRSILLYPSLCFFEGTPLSIGRGTQTQFQVIGHPDVPATEYSFTPDSMFGSSSPKLKGQLCYGEDLTKMSVENIFQEGKINLNYLIKYYQSFPDKSSFFNKNRWIDKLAGTTSLRKDILADKNESEIRPGWQEDLASFQVVRKKYLIYE